MAYTLDPKGTYEVSDDGGSNYHRIFNVTAFTISGGDREETITDTLDEGSVISVGPPRPKEISITINANPGTKGYQIVRDGYREEKKITARITTNAKTIFDNSTNSNTIAIASTGVVTASAGVKLQDNANRFVVGRAIVINNVAYVIESITSNTAANVYRADGMAISAVTGTDDWDVVEFGIRYVAECEVMNAVNPDLSPGSPYSDTITLKSTGTIGKPTFILS